MRSQTLLCLKRPPCQANQPGLAGPAPTNGSSLFSRPSELALCSPCRGPSPAPGLCCWHRRLLCVVASFTAGGGGGGEKKQVNDCNYRQQPTTPYLTTGHVLLLITTLPPPTPHPLEEITYIFIPYYDTIDI